MILSIVFRLKPEVSLVLLGRDLRSELKELMPNLVDCLAEATDSNPRMGRSEIENLVVSNITGGLKFSETEKELISVECCVGDHGEVDLLIRTKANCYAPSVAYH